MRRTAPSGIPEQLGIGYPEMRLTPLRRVSFQGTGSPLTRCSPNRAIQSFLQLPIGVRMAAPPTSRHRVAGAARSGVVGTIVAAIAFFDGVFIGAPIALLAAWFRPSLVYVLATVVVVFLVIGCCRWVDRRWDDWFSGNGTRIESGSRRCGRAA